jgi:glycosyltransferase involved in cell wall biosynthesis
MKIAIDARESGTSTGRYVDKLIEYLHKLEPEFDIVVLTKAQRIDYFKTIAPRFATEQTRYKEFTFGEQLGLLRQVWGLKADLVHFAVTQQPVLYGGRVVTTVHDLITARFYNPTKNRLVFTVKQQVYKWVIKRVAKKSVRILTPTEFVKNDLVAFARINPDKVTVTYEAADKITEPPEPFTGLADKEFVMYVGRPQPHKNLRRLIDAFALVKKQHPDLHLVLAGKNDKAFEQLKSYANMNAIKDVVFTGFVSEGQLRWFYEQARAYVFPSLSEGFGLPGLEAMHYSLPVVSSNATCLPEVYQNAALYFDPKNINDMAEKISAVLDNPELAQKLIREGRQLVQAYSWRRMAEQTLEAYNKALNLS